MATQPQYMGPDEDDVRIETVSADALAIINKSDIEQAVDLAKRFPRDIERVRQKLTKYACLNQHVATSMFYSKPQGTGFVVGPGVRFAETLCNCWTNTRSGVRIVGERGDVAVATGLFFDAETNNAIQVDAQRSILTKEKRRFSADMIVTTGNAAASVAYRNAIFRGIPRAMWDDIYLQAKETAVGKAESFVSQVNTALEEFAKSGVTQVMLLNFLGVPSVREIGPDNILILRTVFADLRSGEKTIEDIFGSPEQAEIDSIMEQLGWNPTKQRMSMTQYKGKPKEHLDYLRSQLPKGEQQKPASTTNAAGAAPKQQQPVPQSIPDLKQQLRDSVATEEAANQQQQGIQGQADQKPADPKPEPTPINSAPKRSSAKAAW